MESDQQIDRALDTLQRKLDLSAAQSSDIRRLVQSRRADLRSIREQTRTKFEALMKLLDQPNPDPATIGRATIELKAMHDQARTKQADIESQITNLLSPSQRQIVSNLRDQAETFWALRRIGLVRGPGFGPGMFRDRNVEVSGGAETE